MSPRVASVVVVLAGALLLGTLLVTLTANAAAPDDLVGGSRWGFSQGARPLVVEAADGGLLSARGCAACHRAVFDDWQSTRHAAAFSNPVFLDGFAREPQARCIHCHAPLLEQRRELGPLRVPSTSSASASAAASSASSSARATSLLHEGVTCAACHVRGGKVLVTRAVRPDDGGPMHDVVVEPALSDPAFCASCHQFGFTGDDARQEGLMQGTWDEWRRYADAGGAGTCQSCHMPGGRHLFRGAWDTALLERSLRVDVVSGEEDRAGGGRALSLSLSSVDVGHSFPTGDLFRHLTVEAAVDDRWIVLARIGRSFGLVHDNDGGGERATAARPKKKRLLRDTSIQPQQPQTVALPATAAAWRVRYHYAEERHERDGVVAPVVIAAGRLR